MRRSESEEGAASSASVILPALARVTDVPRQMTPLRAADRVNYLYSGFESEDVGFRVVWPLEGERD